MTFPSRAEVARVKREYPIGSRVVLDEMDDVQAPPIGTQGTVCYVDDIGSIGVAWDNGGGLNVAYGQDRCHIVRTEEEAKTTLLPAAAKRMDQNKCPRCGTEIYDPHTRALSRRLHIMICESCGTAEALEDLLVYQGQGKEARKPLLDWAALRPEWWGGGAG